jgi:hypothetical protein
VAKRAPAARATGPTPGPWRAEGVHAADVPSGRVVAQVWSGYLVDKPSRFCVVHDGDAEGDYGADARLIAAAPDLLAACEAQSAAVEHEGRCVECFSGVCAEGHRLRYRAAELRGVVLAKARGDGRG